MTKRSGPPSGAAEVAPRPGQAAASKGGGFYIPSLDGMRAVAFMIVFIAHARIVSHFPGNFGVTVFFFLSGFLITTLMRMEYDQTGRISFRQFYLRRVFRIFPPFYLILGVTALLIWAGVFVGDVGAAPVLSQMFHFSNYRLIFWGYQGYPLGTYAYWSLAVEEHFYLAFPLVYFLLRRHVPNAKRQALILLGICAVVLIWRCILVFGFDPSMDRTYIATDTRIDSILFGCALAVWCNPMLDPRWISDRLLKYLLLPVSLIALLATFFGPEPVFTETVRYTIQGIALVPVFTAVMLFPSWGPIRLLNLAPVRFMGLLSYSLYLMHEVAIYNLYPHVHANRFVQAGVALGASVLVASAIYYVIERPCARLRKRLSYRAAAAGRQAAPAEPESLPSQAVSLGGRAATVES